MNLTAWCEERAWAEFRAEFQDFSRVAQQNKMEYELARFESWRREVSLAIHLEPLRQPLGPLRMPKLFPKQLYHSRLCGCEILRRISGFHLFSSTCDCCFHWQREVFRWSSGYVGSCFYLKGGNFWDCETLKLALGVHNQPSHSLLMSLFCIFLIMIDWSIKNKLSAFKNTQQRRPSPTPQKRASFRYLQSPPFFFRENFLAARTS